ncbi:hypothetical protein Q3G72_021733 [Acer saccharum]|nr:hypothetical protein Q3G72_014701 [Acer saccharum]KAK1571713.1 hypothetical protein Q3G72_021733 [Acer saccharum]
MEVKACHTKLAAFFHLKVSCIQEQIISAFLKPQEMMTEIAKSGGVAGAGWRDIPSFVSFINAFSGY